MPNVIRFQSSYAEPYPLQVQGESNYKDNIEAICGYVDDDEGVNADDFIARLVLEDSNRYDPGNAVRIEIDGKTVGYLSKPGAKAYRKRLTAIGLSDVTGECYASIKGGFIKKSTGEQADFGVKLDLNLEDFEVLPAKPQPTAAPIPPAVNPSPAKDGGPVFMDVQPHAKSPLRKILDWFFGPSENRTLRIVLFFFLALGLSFCACIACGTILRFIPGNS